MIDKKELIKNMTTKQIANETFTSPSTLIRIAQKLGYSGWNELKVSYVEEIEYINSHFNEIDANIPFEKGDSVMSIANKISSLVTESIKDTLYLMKPDKLKEAIDTINNSDYINIYALSNVLLLAQDFSNKMSRIKKNVNVCMIESEQNYIAAQSSSNSCAIIISYSGESNYITEVSTFLKENNVPIIAVTSLGENTLSKIADCTLNICTREKLYSKIGNFSSSSSIIYVLDTLYAGVFELNYDANLKHKINMSRRIERMRHSDVDILKED